MKSLLRITIIVVIACLLACKCDETKTCEGVSLEGRTILPVNLEQQTFQNAFGETKNILLRGAQIQDTFTEDCGDCECNNECPNRIGRFTYGLTPFPSVDIVKTDIQGGTTLGTVFYPNDTCIFRTITRNEEVYTITLEESSSANATLQLDFLGFSYLFNAQRDGGRYVITANVQDSGIKLLPSFVTPEQTYSNIFEMDNSATRLSTRSTHFRKLYYSSTEGVIAYLSPQNELFYIVK